MVKAMAEDAAPADAPHNPMTDQSLDIFHQYLHQFLEAVAEVWSDCSETAKRKLEDEIACQHGHAHG